MIFKGLKDDIKPGYVSMIKVVYVAMEGEYEGYHTFHPFKTFQEALRFILTSPKRRPYGAFPWPGIAELNIESGTMRTIYELEWMYKSEKFPLGWYRVLRDDR
jgi:hypothetical protein